MSQKLLPSLVLGLAGGVGFYFIAFTFPFWPTGIFDNVNAGTETILLTWWICCDPVLAIIVGLIVTYIVYSRLKDKPL